MHANFERNLERHPSTGVKARSTSPVRLLARGAEADNPISPMMVVAALAAADVLGCILLGTLIFAVYGLGNDYDTQQLVQGLCLFTLTWFAGSQSQGLYRRETLLRIGHRLGPVALAWSIAFGLLLLMAFGLKVIGGFSRFWLVAWAAGCLVWLLIVRLVWDARLRRLLAAHHYLELAIVVATDKAVAERLAETFETATRGRTRVSSIIMLPPNADDGSAEHAAALLATQQRARRYDRVLLAQAGFPPQLMAALCNHLRPLAIEVSLVPDVSTLPGGVVRAEVQAGIALLSIVTQPLSSWQSMAKRTEDVIVSGLALLLLSPLMLAVAVAIRLGSPGPILFRQIRVGLRGEAFEVLKFRSMRHASTSGGPFRQTARNDDRITRIGRLIRRSSIDELPQLFNVLGGSMSLVGPRPHAVQMRTAGKALEAIAEDYAWRHRIKPGMTGWAQINGLRGEVDSEAKLHARIRHDLHYIDNWSLAFDLWILLRTGAVVLFDRRAY